MKTLAAAKKLQKNSEENDFQLKSIVIPKKQPKDVEVLQADAQDQVMETTRAQSLQQTQSSSEKKLQAAET